MKNKILITILLAFPLVSQAQNSVTLFGILDNGITYVSNSGAHSLVQMASGIQAPNVIGLRGIEDLGGGFQAIFVMDSQPDLNTGKAQGERFLAANPTWVSHRYMAL